MINNLDFKNKSINNLINSKLGIRTHNEPTNKFEKIKNTLSDVSVEILDKVDSVVNKKNHLYKHAIQNAVINKYSKAFNISKNTLIYMFAKEIAKLSPYNADQPDNLFKVGHITLPVVNEQTKQWDAKKYDCVYFGGIFHVEKLQDESEQDIYNNVTKYINSNNVFIFGETQKNGADELINVNEDNSYYNQQIVNQKYTYPTVHLSDNALSHPILNKCILNLVARKLISISEELFNSDYITEKNVISLEDVKQALGDDFMEIPSEEQITSGKITYNKRRGDISFKLPRVTDEKHDIMKTAPKIKSTNYNNLGRGPIL